MDIATTHRPWPLLQRSWIMFQVWEDLLFAHWPLPAEVMATLIPPPLTLDTFNGQAWIGVVPFRITGLRARFLPPMPRVSSFPELNVRTYVTVGDKPGVYFFSLDAGSMTAVKAARTFFKLPYFKARMTVSAEGSSVRYSSRRIHPGAPAAEFIGAYRPTGEVFHAEPGTLEHFLTERYCFYTVEGNRKAYRCDIHHAPWPLQLAEADFDRNTMTSPQGITLPAAKPLLHFARCQPTVIWPLAQVKG